jgi:oligopeptide/dipeptide ABC transporter ATP-binding protein
VHGLDLSVAPGEMVGLVGESGSGKTLSALAIAGLLPPNIEVVAGEVSVEGQILPGTGPQRRRGLSMIFQNPMTSLNPSQRVGAQVAEAVRKNRAGVSRAGAKAETVELLARVELKDPPRVARAYPHELSGGMRQRIMIAMALACEPRVLIADEPTTALDVTVQRGVMDLLQRLQGELGLAVLLISHDLALVGERSDQLLVMYAGEVVERGSTEAVLEHAAHPYVSGLLGCSPERASSMDDLHPLPGRVPRPGEVTVGCRFAARCAHAMDVCLREAPPSFEVAPGHTASCHLLGEAPAESLPMVEEVAR